MDAKLSFIYGVMSSGKTLKLLATAHDFDTKRIPILVIKPSVDNRDSETKVVARIGLERKCIPIEPTINLFKMVDDINHMRLAEGDVPIKHLLVDECQFLTEEQIDQLSNIVDYLGIDVKCYGLRTDFMSNIFPASKRLFEISDKIEEIESLCDCGNKASINARFDENGRIITTGGQILIGGNDKYRPICRKCWKKLLNEK